MTVMRLHWQFRYCTAFAVTIAAVLLLIIGCGYDGQEPAYDCDANPDHFPEIAVDFLRGVEGGYVRTAADITERFAAIYTAHPSLLSDRTWAGVTRRLGIRLKYRADRLVEDGLLQYAQAADYYSIAAQTHPDDSLLAERARLFSIWRIAAADSTFDVSRLAAAGEFSFESVTFKMSALTRFALRSDAHFQFARQYLTAALFPPGVVDDFKSSNSAAGLAPPDCALLAALGLLPAAFDTTVARFTRPEIDIPAVRVAPVAPDSFCIEIYFLPREPISADLGISLWVETPDPVLPADKQPRFPFDFKPATPTSSWTPGEVAIGLQHISFRYPVSAVLLGLYDTTSGHPVYLPHEGAGGDRIRIPIPSGTTGN